MVIEIICPLYNGEKYIKKLIDSINKQKRVLIKRTLFVLTQTNDNSEKILNKLNLDYESILPNDFSHSLTREIYAMQSSSDIIVFITQDIVIEDELWLYNLTKDIGKNGVVAAYSRQISKFNNLEKYTREKNYPNKSKIVSKNDIELLGLNTFFFSDASGAIETRIFKELNGYDSKKLPISEDMYFTYKLIMNGYKVKYESDSIIYHSHNFTLKQLYNRYKLTGMFFKQNSYLDKYGTNKSGGGLAKYILKRAIKDKNFKVIIRFIPDMATRFIGMKVGKYNGK